MYLNPPNKNVAIFNQVLHLMEPVKTGTINMPIDYFFQSFSEDQKERAIALVLSGTASDGTLGVKAVKGEGRLAVHQIDSLPDYILFLQKKPAEIQMLFKNLVIGVTSFFRDPKAYDALETKALAKLIEARHPEDTLRCWVVGCSTGEEAYSLAILISEVMEKLKKHINVQVFATDIDEVAIDTARKGVYPASISGDVSKERLRQFFVKEESFYKVKKQVRDMVIFSLQSVIKDPPFSKLDVVSCRNLMIYLDVTLQKKMIPIFHYTLNPGGVLQLGTSETIGEFTDLFSPVDSKWKVYHRKEGLSSGVVDYSRGIAYEKAEGAGTEAGQKRPAPTNIQALAEKAMLNGYAPSGVLVNDKYEILHFVGQTEKYLVPPTGKPSFNILTMAR